MGKLLQYCIWGVAAAIALSCSEELKPTPYTYTKLFTGENNKTWKIKIFEETLNDEVIDRFLPGCISDDRFKFYANAERLYETTSGSQKCFDGEPSLTSSTWTFANSSATLTMIIPALADGTLPFFVREADEDDMVIEIFFDETNTSSYRIHFESVDEE